MEEVGRARRQENKQGLLEPGLGLPSTTQQRGLLSFTSRAGDLGPWSLAHSGQPTPRPGSQAPCIFLFRRGAPGAPPPGPRLQSGRAFQL